MPSGAGFAGATHDGPLRPPAVCPLTSEIELAAQLGVTNLCTERARPQVRRKPEPRPQAVSRAKRVQVRDPHEPLATTPGGRPLDRMKPMVAGRGRLEKMRRRG
jgi:hypothetical protein